MRAHPDDAGRQDNAAHPEAALRNLFPRGDAGEMQPGGQGGGGDRGRDARQRGFDAQGRAHSTEDGDRQAAVVAGRPHMQAARCRSRRTSSEGVRHGHAVPLLGCRLRQAPPRGSRAVHRRGHRHSRRRRRHPPRRGAFRHRCRDLRGLAQVLPRPAHARRRSREARHERRPRGGCGAPSPNASPALRGSAASCASSATFARCRRPSASERPPARSCKRCSRRKTPPWCARPATPP